MELRLPLLNTQILIAILMDVLNYPCMLYRRVPLVCYILESDSSLFNIFWFSYHFKEAKER